MAQTMSPSVRKELTDGQIEKATDAYRAMLRKHRSELASEEAQQVLTQADYLGEQLAVLRSRVEAVSEMIVRRVKVNRQRTPQEMLVATGRTQYVDSTVVDTMPRSEGEEVEVWFFPLGRYVSDDNLDGECAKRGLVMADPYSVAAVNEADPTFADKHPNGVHWKDANGKWCYAAFSQWHGGGRRVRVGRSDRGWDDFWWFAGLRKVS